MKIQVKKKLTFLGGSKMKRVMVWVVAVMFLMTGSVFAADMKAAQDTKAPAADTKVTQDTKADDMPAQEIKAGEKKNKCKHHKAKCKKHAKCKNKAKCKKAANKKAMEEKKVEEKK
jgi:hypothetical protein